MPPPDTELSDRQDSSNKGQDKTKDLPDVLFVDPKNELNQRAPVDRYNIVFAILLIHGIGTLMPWNMFINAEDYFRNYKLMSNNNTVDNMASSEEVGLDNARKNFLNYLCVASQIPNVLFNGLNLIANMGSGNLKLRVNLTLIMEVIIFAFTIALAIIDSSKWKMTFFYLTLLSVVVLNMASGIYQNCVFGLSAKFPGKYTNAILIGSNFSGTFTSIVNLLAIWLAPAPQEAAIYYFVTALIIIFVCIVSYNCLPYNRFYRFFDDDSNQQDSHELVDKSTSANSSETQKDPRDAEEGSTRPVTTFMGELEKKWQVFQKCWPQCLNVFLTFYFTLALFPAVLANVKLSQNYFSAKYFTPFACFLVFNVFALIGNIVSGWTTWPGKDHLWIAVIGRTLFVPFFLFCNFNPTSRHWPVLITNDIVFIIGNILFAFSSGYFSSLCMMFASKGLKTDEAPKAGMLAAFFLVFGIFMGVASSFILTSIVEIG